LRDESRNVLLLVIMPGGHFQPKEPIAMPSAKIFVHGRILGALVLALCLAIPAAWAKDVPPMGEKVALDPQGRAVYQVEANGIKIGYKLIGSGEPLLLLTGMGCTMERWSPEFIEAASGKYQLIVVDNRGMGYSTDNGAPFDYELFAKDAVALLDRLGVAKTNVLGYSQSSVTTQNLLLSYPGRIGKAVIHATSIDGKAVSEAFKGASLPDNPTVAKQLEAAMGWRTPLDKMALVENQVMLLVGTADTIVGAQSSKTLAGLIPGAWLVQFKNGTHHLQFEAPREFARIVLAFLEMDETVALRPK
jgi:pimeloyl-ACP methyl ester carboxylesterase